MKRLSKRTIAVLLAVSMLSGGMAGCSGKISSDDSKPIKSGQKSSAKKDGKSYVEAAKKNTNFNATGDKILNKEQKFTVWIGQMSSEKKANMKKCSQDAEKATNVKINWVEVPISGWKEKTNVVLASGELPDAFCGGIDISNYATRFVPLNELVEAYAPTTQKLFEERPDYPPALSDGEGIIRGLPTGDEFIGNSLDSQLWINQQWLDRVNMKMPTSTEEFEQVLRAFKEKDANGNGNAKDEIPFAFRSLRAWGTGCSEIFGSFGAPESGSHIFRTSDNKIKLAAQQDGYYKCLKWLHKLYADGLLSDTCFTDSADAYATKNVGKDIIGSYMDYGPSALGNTKIANTWYKKGKSRVFAHVPPLKGPDGERMIFQESMTRDPGFLITTKCKNPEVLVRWYDYVNTGLENVMSWRWGPENIAWKESKLTQKQADEYKKSTGKDISKAPVPLKVGDKVPLRLDITMDIAKKHGYADKTALSNAEAFSGWSPAFSYNAKTAEIPMEIPLPEIKKHACEDDISMATVVHGIPKGIYTKENAQKQANLLTDLDNYLTRFVSDSVVNGIDDAKWQKHLQQLKNLKADEYVKLCQEATDNILNRTSK